MKTLCYSVRTQLLRDLLAHSYKHGYKPRLASHVMPGIAVPLFYGATHLCPLMFPILFQLFLVTHTKTLLLIQNEQAQIFKTDIFLQQSMCADHNVQFAGF